MEKLFRFKSLFTLENGFIESCIVMNNEAHAIQATGSSDLNLASPLILMLHPIHVQIKDLLFG